MHTDNSRNMNPVEFRDVAVPDRFELHVGFDPVAQAASRASGGFGEGDSELDIMQSIPATSPTPDRLAFSDQVQTRITAALDELSPQERTAFILRHFEGLSIEQIGASLGTGTNATKHSIFRAVQKLRRNWSPL